MKECFKCKKEKSLSSFYKHPQMKDGRVNKCKECNKKDVRENRAEKIDYYRDYDKDRAMLPHRVKARSEYQMTDAGKASMNKAHQNWLEHNTVKRAAHIMLGNAVRDGKIVKSDACAVCWTTKGRIHGHHDDYAKPLEVRWLCPKCHSDWHKENGPALNG